jgi:hypothetical protein
VNLLDVLIQFSGENTATSAQLIEFDPAPQRYLVQPIASLDKLPSSKTPSLFVFSSIYTIASNLIKMWAGTSSSNPASPTTKEIPSASKPNPYRLKNQGRRYAQIVKLKPEFVDKYKEVETILRQCR